MAKWQQTLYEIAPWAVKEWLVGLEARRRNRYRRNRDYPTLKKKFSFDQYRQLSLEAIRVQQLEKLQHVIRDANQHSPYYRDRLQEIRHLDDMKTLPILTKSDLRKYMSDLKRDGYPKQYLWAGTTSGSTGTPLNLLLSRDSIGIRFAILDNYYELFDCLYGQRRVRMGGSKIKPADSQQPPFWIMNHPDNQLQVSPYHLNEKSFPFYRDRLNAFAPVYFSGYAHALYNLAYFYCQYGGRNYTPKAVFLDSEGVPPDCRPVIEEGLGVSAFQNYGLGEVGLVAVEYPDHYTRVLDLSVLLEVVDDEGNPLPDGESGRLIVTDLTQTNVPFVRYDTGDIGSIFSDRKDGIWSGTILASIDGRSDDIIITPQGRQVGRLSHVTKPGRGIVESQIAHVAPSKVVIRIVPADNFEKESMLDVVQTAQMLLGTDMEITWEIVDHIPRTNLHKFKHVVKEFDSDIADAR